MTNQLVVIINSLKVPKIKKILLYEMKFLVPNYSWLQNPWLAGYRHQIPVLSVLCPQLNLLTPPPEQNSWVRHCTELHMSLWTTWNALWPSSTAPDIFILFVTNMFSRWTFFIKIRSVAVEMFHADGRTDGRTWRISRLLFAALRTCLELYERVCDTRKLTGLLVKTLYIQRMWGSRWHIG